jgi:hypothetical protein
MSSAFVDKRKILGSEDADSRSTAVMRCSAVMEAPIREATVVDRSILEVRVQALLGQGLLRFSPPCMSLACH